MTDAEFEAMFDASLARLDAYIATQISERQVFQAKCRRKHVEQNKPFWKFRAAKGDQLIQCVQCGALDTLDYCEPNKSQMAASGHCYHCNYWDQLVLKDDPRRLIIDGHIYTDGGNQPNASWKHLLGFGGEVWRIERDGCVWQTNNLWSGSTVPQEHRDSLPDNARFVWEA
ncbi:hypothetical protein [Burkholderia multivorans]|uniref:hypothetical protein n=1 Tax=Burkholderia multivorans TaxID=87883 RepID=UPI0021C0A2B4|nr:hypothetical protein [Burkholderia multivorans]